MTFDTDYVIDMIDKQINSYDSLKGLSENNLTPHQESFIDGVRFVIEQVKENRIKNANKEKNND